MKQITFPFVVLVALFCPSRINAQQPDPVYFNEIPPGTTPEIFAPGKVSKDDEFEFGSVFSNDMTEFYYSVETNGKTETRMAEFRNGKWGDPVTILTHAEYSYNDPFLTPDGKRLFFISNRSLEGTGQKKDYDIWFIERRAGTWSEPLNAGANINSSENEYYISFTREGTMYFSSNRQNPHNYDIYSSETKEGEFQPPIKLPEEVNTPSYEADVFVAPDESFLIFSAIPEGGLASGDLYVSFRNPDGSWTQRKSLGNAINTDTNDFCPYVSPDGKYLFYARERDVYWVSMDVIRGLR